MARFASGFATAELLGHHHLGRDVTGDRYEIEIEIRPGRDRYHV
jgi:hypothetical protein